MDTKLVYTIYKIIEKETNKILYIGMSKNFSKRRYDHLHLDATSTKKWIKEIGSDKIDVLSICEFNNKADAAKFEDIFIEHYKPEHNHNRSNMATKNPDYYKTDYWKEYHKRYMMDEDHKNSKREAARRYYYNHREEIRRKYEENKETIKLKRILGDEYENYVYENVQ